MKDELTREFLDDLKYIVTGRNGYYYGLQEDKYNKIVEKWEKKLTQEPTVPQTGVNWKYMERLCPKCKTRCKVIYNFFTNKYLCTSCSKVFTQRDL